MRRSDASLKGAQVGYRIWFLILLLILFVPPGVAEGPRILSLLLDEGLAPPSQTIRQADLTRMSDAADAALSAARRVRLGRLNPAALAPDALREGDVLYLGLFDDLHLWARIDHVSVDANGVLTVRGRFDDSPHGVLIVSIQDERVLASIELPEQDREVLIADLGAGIGHVIQEIDPARKDVLEGPTDLLRPDALVAPPSPDASSSDGQLGMAPQARSAATPVATPALIDLMVVYTPAARDWARSAASGIDQVINQALARAQLALDNSEIPIQVRLVHAALVDYVESGDGYLDLYRLTYHQGYDPHRLEGEPRDLEEVHAWRDAYGADLVVLLADVEDVGGLGWLLTEVGGRPELAFALTRVRQAHNTYTMIHEIGHVLGAHHHKEQLIEPGPGLFPYSAGWRWIGEDAGRYASVMTYGSGTFFADGRTHTRVPYFSTPRLRHAGVAVGDPLDGDNARTLTEVRDTVMQYRPMVVCSSTNGMIEVGQTLEETLAITDCESPLKRGHWFDRFDFTATAGESYRLTLASHHFEPELLLLDPQGQLLLEGDAGPGESRMRYRALETVRHTIIATSRAPRQIGPYQLSLVREPDPILPSAPSDLTAVVNSDSKITIAWRLNCQHLSGVAIERRSTPAEPWSEMVRLQSPVSRYENSGLAPATTYFYRVRAFNAAGSSAYSNEVSATTLARPTVPAAPSELIATAITPWRIDLQWRDQSSDESGFRIERRTLSGRWSEIGRLGVDETTFSDRGLQAATSYQYRVRAYNAVGPSAYSNEAVATTAPRPTAPVAPSELVATLIAPTEVALRWRDQSLDETEFQIERRADGGNWARIRTVGANLVEYLDTGLQRSTRYEYRVFAANAVGRSDPSNVALITTQSETTQIVSSVLPYARAVAVGEHATGFASLINTGRTTAQGCRIALPAGFPATLTYQTTDATNQLTGLGNQPADIAPGATQSFVFGLRPQRAFVATEIPLSFVCENAAPAASQVGLNTFILSAQVTKPSDLIAIGVTPSGDGVVRLASGSGTGFMAAAAINIGAGAQVNVSVDDGGRALPVELSVCETTAEGIQLTCASRLSRYVPANRTVFYAVFVTGTGQPIPFDPARHRLFLRFSAQGTTVGATSVAVTGP
ncbi:fibronectin type III domain-containing protein [Thiocapsa imhoffii]|nr:fibronectin type III domain-containing protein [Thiocapsa imhoffii]